VVLLLAGSTEAQTREPLGGNVQGLIAAGRELSPALRAAALESEAAVARASGAGALDDPTISDAYQYYKDGGVFSAHTVMVSQAFPLWGKRDLRREAAQADVDAARGKELAARNDLDEKIKVAFAQYGVLTRSISVNLEVQVIARRLRTATETRYAQGGGDQAGAIRAQGQETSVKLELARLEGERNATRARLNTLVARRADAVLADPKFAASTTVVPALAVLLDRAKAGNPTLSSQTAAIAAARKRSALADRAWYPDVTVAAGPIIQANNRPVGFAATVGLNIPVPWGREASGQQEAAANVGATQLRYDAVLLDIEGALGEARARLEAARQTAGLLRKESLPQARATLRAVTAAYGLGRGDLGTAIEAENRIHDVELLALRADLDGAVALAAIERLIGGEL
jgi:outer membrane protein TolC